MADKTFTRDDLRVAIQGTLPKLSWKEATRLIEATLREVEDALVLVSKLGPLRSLLFYAVV